MPRRKNGRLPLAEGHPRALRGVRASSDCRRADARRHQRLSAFSRRVIEQIAVESEQGFCYSIELLVKTHRLGWRVAEVPAVWFERKHGVSRFKVLRWLPAYLRWFGYAFATRFLRRTPETVTMKASKG